MSYMLSCVRMVFLLKVALPVVRDAWRRHTTLGEEALILKIDMGVEKGRKSGRDNDENVTESIGGHSEEHDATL